MYNNQPPGLPIPNDRIWLVWRPQHAASSLFLLGGGTVLPLANPRAGTDVLHTDADDPGVRGAAEALGYGGPTNMTFLKLKDVRICNQNITGRLNVVPGPQVCSPTAVLFLNGICPIP